MAENKEWTVGKPIEIKGKKDSGFVVQCSNCNGNVIFPNEPPNCPNGCLERMDLCKHGIACQDCSNKLIVEYIKEGNMKAEGEQLKQIKAMVKRVHKKEVIVNADGYLEIKKE